MGLRFVFRSPKLITTAGCAEKALSSLDTGSPTAWVAEEIIQKYKLFFFFSADSLEALKVCHSLELC